ncbi:hypothetical protein PIB30_083905 [Stylosanthes scabra]|uniref:CCHC-type domain-containing protein n=1 Tax=Stylosanthes scabra TaxID=79078 RepID=A0ABU6YQ10_9FABA|nr:hypothetical protein [Stylosanthes scabra]
MENMENEASFSSWISQATLLFNRGVFVRWLKKLLLCTVKRLLVRSDNTLSESVGGKKSPPWRGVQDPRKVRTKGCGRAEEGGQKRKRVVHCSICNKTGHNCRNCPEKEKRSLQDALDDDDAYATLDPENLCDEPMPEES